MKRSPSTWTDLPVDTREGVLDRVHLAYVGTLSTQDGVEGLALVLAGLRHLDPPVAADLTIIGDGDARSMLEAEFARYGVDDCVVFTGWVPIERLPSLLRAADVCVDPAPATDVNVRAMMNSEHALISAYSALERRG